MTASSNKTAWRQGRDATALGRIRFGRRFLGRGSIPGRRSSRGCLSGWRPYDQKALVFGQAGGAEDIYFAEILVYYVNTPVFVHRDA